MIEFFDVYNIRVLFALVMLGVASVIDIWKREINDVLWIIFGGIAAILVFFEPNFLHALTSVGISLIISPVALILWRTGIFGGADALGLITLSALAPMTSLSENTVTPFTTLTNAALLSITPLFTNLIHNLYAISNHQKIFEGFEETKLRKIGALFLGYRSKNPKYSFQIETVEGNHKKLDFSPHHAEKAKFCNSTDMWVTPGIPYLLYISIGFVIQLLYGDIILNILTNVK